VQQALQLLALLQVLLLLLLFLQQRLPLQQTLLQQLEQLHRDRAAGGELAQARHQLRG